MMEPQDNIYFTCPEHASKPDPKFARMPITTFIGRYIKKGFPEKGTSRTEHLWVEIKEVKNDDTLIGNISNDPTLNVGLKDGDQVEVKVTEIEDLYEDEE